MGPETASALNAPELLAIGHVTWDLSPDDLNRREPGGAVAFAAITAAQLGVKPAIVTSCADDYPMREVIDNPSDVVRIPSLTTSTFENRYDSRGDRVQLLHGRASDIEAHHIPDGWRNPDMLFVGPLTQEIPENCLEWFEPRVSCVVPQGWLRSWDLPLPSAIEVSKSPPANISREWDICVLSESETSDATMPDWREVARNLVVTKGSQGADLYVTGRTTPIPIPARNDVGGDVGFDTTGAGDVFAAAMLIRYAATGDPVDAAQYASICAALSTRARSWDAVEMPPTKLVADDR